MISRIVDKVYFKHGRTVVLYKVYFLKFNIYSYEVIL